MSERATTSSCKFVWLLKLFLGELLSLTALILQLLVTFLKSQRAAVSGLHRSPLVAFRSGLMFSPAWCSCGLEGRNAEMEAVGTRG